MKIVHNFCGIMKMQCKTAAIYFWLTNPSLRNDNATPISIGVSTAERRILLYDLIAPKKEVPEGLIAFSAQSASPAIREAVLGLRNERFVAFPI